MLLHKCLIPFDLFYQIKNIVANCQNSKDYNSTLAGNMKLEKSLVEHIDLLEPFLKNEILNSEGLKPNLNKFINLFKYNNEDTSINLDIKLRTLWVNFQLKHEFNPLHDHTGLFSFVIFVQIPYLMEEQIKQSPGARSNSPNPGQLVFIRNGPTKPEFIKLPIDKTYEQKCFIFPSEYLHEVYPFYNVELPRITISGNFYGTVK